MTDDEVTYIVAAATIPDFSRSPAWHLGARVQAHVPVILSADAEADPLNALRFESMRFPCGGRVIGHHAQQQGRVGTVGQCSGGFPCQYGSAIGHGVYVVYDAPYIEADQSWYAGHYAADELVTCAGC